MLAIDPGDQLLGLALSDETGVIARPLTTLAHESRAKDAERLVALAVEHQAEMILVGLALDSSGHVGPQARKAERLVEAIRSLTALPVVTHDESFTSASAQDALLAAGKKRRARREQIHAVAAAALLQSYLDAHPRE
jgi:putative Holliday junction resolvase